MSKMDSSLKEKPCAQCGKPAVEKFRPFCSARCKQIDLGRWFSGTFRVETNEGPGDESSGGERE